MGKLQLGVNLACIILALTRPQYGIEQSEVPQSGRNVFIAVDTSKSMLADDMSPNRLTRAKLAAQDLLEGFEFLNRVDLEIMKLVTSRCNTGIVVHRFKARPLFLCLEMEMEMVV